MIDTPVWVSLSASFLAGVVLVAAVREIARNRGVVARPRADRWHQQPTALMGGIGIWAAVLASLAIAGVGIHSTWSILLGGTLLCALGAFDDLRDVKPATKVVVQVVAAAIAISAGLKITFFQIELLNVLSSFVWIVAITNAVNLLDNMDGLAGGVVMIAAAYLGATYGLEGLSEHAAVAFGLAGALAAFLFFNVNPASVFMGDSGSLFIGFGLGTLSLARTEASSILSFVAVPAATLLVPILDTTLVTVTRILRGQSIAEGGRDHTSHRLVMLGLSEKEAVFVLWLLALTAGGSAIVTERYSYTLGIGLLPLIVVGFGLLGIYLSQIAVVGVDKLPSSSPKGFVRLAFEFSFKRRVLEVLLDLVLVIACYYLAYGFRFGFEVTGSVLARFNESLPLVVGSSMIAFHYLGVYRGVWTYVSVQDLVRFVQSSLLATLFSLACVIAVYRFEAYSRSVFALYAVLMIVALGGTRISFRMMDEALSRRRPGRAVLVVGAGSGGEIVVRELLRNPELGMRPVGFADDDVSKHKRRIHGYPVLGGTNELDRILAAVPFDEALISSRKLDGKAAERVRAFCERNGLQVRFLRLEFDSDPPRVLRRENEEECPPKNREARPAVSN